MALDSTQPINQEVVSTPEKGVTWPTLGETITSAATQNTYIFGEKIGEGSFGSVYACVDVWGNDLAAKVLKPTNTYEYVRSSAQAELQKLLTLRHPNVTYIHDAFEFRDTFYIITERCYCPLTELFDLDQFAGLGWLMPVARCLLQAAHYIHISGYVHQDIHLGNVFAAFAKDEVSPTEPGSIQFKLGDFGVAKVFGELDATNTRALWMLPPEVINEAEFGPIDHRVDIYHIALLLLQFASSRQIKFTDEERLAGRPRDLALKLPSPYSFALEKALRRHVRFRTQSVMEFWRDLHTPAAAPTLELGQ